MRNFNYEKLAERTWENEIVAYIAKIHEYKGKQELYSRVKPIELERLIEIAKIQSTEASNRIEGIVTTDARLKQLISDKTTPKNRDEEEILGYRDVLDVIHENYKYIYLTPNYILQLHSKLLARTPLSYGGKFKTTANEIVMVYPDGKKETLFVPVSPYETPEAMRILCESYDSAIKKELIDPLILIPCFILDFLCIHPFNDGNGRMSRLLTLLLLYQSGYEVGKYVSIEKAIADSKEEYYNSLAISDRNWHEEKNDPKPFIKYYLSIILSCYREFEKRVGTISDNGVKSTAYNIVKKYVEESIGVFTKQDVLINCPKLGSSSVEASLKKLVEEGILERLGTGRKTCYVKKI